MFFLKRLLVCLAIAANYFVSGMNCIAEDSPADEVEFNRDIRPILSSRCLHCHGPDPATREAELRLDDAHDVLRQRDDHRVLVPGQPEKSELFRRLTTEDDAERMPPVDSGKKISPSERDLIRRWILQGAQFQKHWSLIAPKQESFPAVKNLPWCKNEIDRFVLARLEKEKLAPSSPTEKTTLLRRVAFDLTGLPPTLQELDNFLADSSDAAYEKAVDRLLKSTAYGEHRARYWLDAARYADTTGYFTDDERQMWQWRDWVISAFNRNMPFDQFTIEQLAGDLLPKPTQSQLIATGFNRNHMTTIETGVIDEEYRVEYVVNRVETTSTVWLGLTMGCARCHDHKFDPISQKEFYEFFAFFNNVAETGNSGRKGNALPILNVPTPKYTEKLNLLKQQSADAQQKIKTLEPELQKSQSAWEQTAVDQLPQLVNDGLVMHFPFDTNGNDESGNRNHAKPTGKTTFETGWIGSAAKFDGDTVFESTTAPDFDRQDSFSFGGWMKPASGGPVCLLSKNDDVNSLRGFDLMLRKGKLVVHFINKWNSNAIQVVSAASIRTGRWQHVMVTYDGSSKASGVTVYLDGAPQAVGVKYDNLTATIKTDQPFRLGRRSTSAAYKGELDDVRIYRRTLSPQDVSDLYTQQMLSGILNTPEKQRGQNQIEALRSYYLSHVAPENFRSAYRISTELKNKTSALARRQPSTMVMQENLKPRDTFILSRGQYDQPGEKVASGVPRSLPGMEKNSPRNRLGLAKWLVDRGHPLTARVTVNRIWQQIFGNGLVKSSEDFGSQGDWPSHPALLDWLAVEFMDTGWDMKRLLKTIVMSNTYQQSSRTLAALRERDPENRLLARGPRFRLDAEVVRDSSLKISGLLVNKIGGPSVKPYQPAGLWAAVSYDGDAVYQQGKQDELYRRSFYTYWKRQSPPPSLMAFDAPTRETCTVKRPRTNTPLQALVLMNDPTYIEAARVMAQKVILSTENDRKRIQRAFRLATGRLPDAEETKVLQRILDQQLDRYRKQPASAKRLLAVGESDRQKSIDASHHAAWTVVCSLILNLDETVTKN